MSKQFKSHASSSRAVPATGFGGFGGAVAGSTLSYLTEPPSLTTISDPQVVVSFKNLSKKDATTKSRALEDLRSYVQAHPFEQGGVEEPIIEAWIKFYPRISIDNSRRVRELAHNLQYEVLKSTRKRMEKYIPKIVGSWVAGIYDRDRMAARAAKDGISSFLDTDAKVLAFWRRCQPQILDFATEAMEETPQSLSDERTMSADDVQEKYFRVIGSSITLLANLLGKMSEDDILKHEDKYTDILTSKKLWNLVACDDAHTRKAVNHLLIVSLEKRPTIIEANLELIRTAFISEGLKASQSTSAFQLLQALDRLTARYPQVWAPSKKSKKSPMSKLQNFVGRGSQGGPPEFWRTFKSLFSNLPDECLPSDVLISLQVLKVFRDGMSHREEPRTNATEAWSTYFWLISFLARKLPAGKSQSRLFQEALFPVFTQYLHPITENARWSISNKSTGLAKAYLSCAELEDQDTINSLHTEWEKLANDLVARISTSLPEQSKDYEKSQAAVLAESHRWFELVSEVFKLSTLDDSKRSSADPRLSPLVQNSSQIISAALKTTISREGKPFSAAATVEVALRLAPILLELSADTLSSVKSFVDGNLARLMVSPSWSYLVSILNIFRSIPNQKYVAESAWQSAIDGLMALPESVEKARAIAALLANHEVTALAHEDEGLQDYISETILKGIEGGGNIWSLLDVTLTYNSLHEKGEEALLNLTVGKLEPDSPGLDHTFKVLEVISKKKRALLQAENIHVALITKLLALSEINDSKTTSRVMALKAIIDAPSPQSGTETPGHSAMLQVIRENIESTNSQSLSIQTLVSQALELSKSHKDSTALVSILPDCGRWQRCLAPLLLNHKPNPSLAVMRPFAGATFLVTPPGAERVERPERDMNGYSVPLRMAMFTSRLMGIESIKQYLPEELQVDLLYLLALTSELANDQINLLEDNKLFESHLDPDAVDEVRQMVVDIQGLLNGQTAVLDNDFVDDIILEREASAITRKVARRLLQSTASTLGTAYYSAKALSRCIGSMFASGGQKDSIEEWLSETAIFKRPTTNVFGAIGVLIGLEDKLQGSKTVSNFLNQLVSDVAGAKVTQPEKTLHTLVLLNTTLAIFDGDDLPVAQNRLVFAVKQILSWNDSQHLATSNKEIASEACRALQKLLPGIAGIYGSYWSSSLTLCGNIWESHQDGSLTDKELPMVGMSLKLFSILQKMKDSNDDLQDAFTDPEIEQSLNSGLVQVLKLRRAKEHQPLLFVDELLLRHIAKLPVMKVDELSDFYPLLASDFKMIQSAAFDVLEKALPAAQEQISVDVLLENRDAKLPEELLSLLLDAPSVQKFPEEILAEFPPSIRGYLLSWHIVFDAYKTASFKVRNDYTESLKSENYLGPLLDFLFDFLGHSAADAIDLERSRFDHDMIRNYDMWRGFDSEGNERDMQWLLINLYYLSLKFLPGLVKNWRLECTSRQTSMAVDSWTEKFFSPLVIEDVLQEVSKWGADQEAETEEGKPLIVKVSNRSREVGVGYEVDDVMMQIAIRLPENYPLDSVKVEGVNRIAASEKKWASWLRVTQGVITFSNGSIIDGLNTFRKNVLGHLAGKTECAICYSIISSDKRVPEKRCLTCKNLFHSSCLFKWFASSNQSSCPLCRVPFNYGVMNGRK